MMIRCIGAPYETGHQHGAPNYFDQPVRVLSPDNSANQRILAGLILDVGDDRDDLARSQLGGERIQEFAVRSLVQQQGDLPALLLKVNPERS